MAEKANQPLVLFTSVKRKLHYGWVIFGLTFANLTIEGGAKNSQPVFLLALRKSFGSSVTLTSAIFSVAGLGGCLSDIRRRLLSGGGAAEPDLTATSARLFGSITRPRAGLARCIGLAEVPGDYRRRS